MHELAIAEGILHVALEAAGPDEKVKSIHLRIGDLQHLTRDSLQFAFELLSEGTSAEHAQIEITKVPAHFACHGCNSQFDLVDAVMVCTSCSGIDLELLSGEEILFDSIELEAGARIEEMNVSMDAILQQHMKEEHRHYFDSEQD